jgi:hypothetical protein
MKSSKEIWELTTSMCILVMGAVIKNFPIQIVGTVLMSISLIRVKNQLSKTEKYFLYGAFIVYLCSLFLYLL